MIPDKIKYSIAESKKGPPTFLVEQDSKSIPLHSKYNPLKEAESLAGSFNPGKYDVLIVLGTGLGYHLIPLSGITGSYKKIVLIDIVENIEKYIRDIRETAFLTGSPVVEFISGLDHDSVMRRLDGIFKLEDVKGISVIEHPTSMRIFKDYYGGIGASIEKKISRMAGSLAAIRAFGGLYLKNVIKNIRNLNKLQSVKSLNDALVSYSAVVVTSGPSLDNYAESLYSRKDELFIIAVDSALECLLLKGIRPDFVVSIDPQPYVREHFPGEGIADAIPVFSISADPEMIARFGGYISMNSHPVAQLLQELFPGSVGTIDSKTGNVAGDALSLAMNLGFKSIGLIGFDFSFPELKIYARGSAYQRRYSLIFNNRMSNTETLNLRYIMNSSRGYKHSGLFSRRSFIAYKNSLEELIRNEGKNNIFNINSYGIPVEGIVNQGFEEFTDKNCSGPVNKDEIRSRLLKDSGRVDDEVDLNRLRTCIMDKDILKSIIDASLDSSDKNDKEKLAVMVEKILKV